MNQAKTWTAHSAVRAVSPQELSWSAPRPRIIDVREPAEFGGELGHVPGAELVPLGTLDAAARAWSKDEPIVVVCRSGARSAKGAALLVQLGFRAVFNLEGGTQAHVSAGLPVERG